MSVHVELYRSGIGSCGELQHDIGIQFVEAVHFSLDVINASPDILPNITLGAIVFDTCEDEVRSMEQLLDMVQLMSTRELQNLPYHCQDGSEPGIMTEASMFHDIVGVVGASMSGISVNMASILRFFRVPQVFISM